jgi:hypothetical protein
MHLHIRHRAVRISALLIFCGTTLVVHAAVEQECSVLDSAGSRTTGGALISVNAVGQPGSVTTSEGGTVTHYGGFLSCVTLVPGLDTDGDGLADEIDADNDNDGLTDLAEVGGNAFMPTTSTDINDADTDDDGASDGAEAQAMTNPQDANAVFVITAITAAGAPVNVEWSARSGKGYNLFAQDDLTVTGSAVFITNVTAVGGSAPWFETTASAGDTGSAPGRSYFIEVTP